MLTIGIEIGSKKEYKDATDYKDAIAIIFPRLKEKMRICFDGVDTYSIVLDCKGLAEQNRAHHIADFLLED